jgi:acetyl esterase
MRTSPRLALTGVSLTVLLGLGAPLALAQAQQSQAASQDSGTMQRADKEDMRPVLMKLQELEAKPIGTQSVEETRKGPTPADAVKALLKDQGKDPDALMAQMNVKKQDMSYPTEGGEQPIRIYTPEGQVPQGGWPVVVYYHGGGWVIADINTYESSAMALAKQANAIVASVEYRHAPENKFPAAHEDAFAAYKWVLDNAQQFGGGRAKVAVAGESAGGNLATNVAIMARDQNVQKPAHMLLVYPVAGVDMNTPSYQKNANAIPLSKQAMEWFVKNTIQSDQDLQSPMLDLVGKADLKSLPDATVITAEIDPLMSEGKILADKLKAAGSQVTYQNHEGVTHEFFGMAAVLDDAKRAQEMAARELKQAFSNVSATGSTGQAAQPKQ